MTSDINGTSQPAPTTDSTNANTLQSIDADVALLSSLLNQDDVDPGADAANLAELLRRLDGANGVAQGLESKIDDVLGNLDNLLAALESKEGELAAAKTDAESTPDAESKEK